MSSRLFPLLCAHLLVALTLCTSCGAPPLELPGNPDEVGVLVIDCTVERSLLCGWRVSQELAGGSISRMDALDQRLAGESVEGVLLFSGLPAGEYALRSVTTAPTLWNSWDGRRISLPLRRLPPEMRVVVEPGEFRYAGSLAVREGAGLSGLGVLCEFRDEPERERATWRRLLHRVRTPPWRSAVLRHIEGCEERCGPGVASRVDGVPR